MNAHLADQRRHHRALSPNFMLSVTPVAAMSAWFLSSVAHLSERTIVLAVMVAAFVTSWIVTSPRRVSNHRVTHIPLHARTR